MLLCLAGVLTERERLIRLYQREEIRILHEQLGKRPRLNDDQPVDWLCLESNSGGSCYVSARR